MSRWTALALLVACKGGKDEDDGTIIPLDEADADTDADADADADTDADSDTDTDTDTDTEPPPLCEALTPPGDAVAVAAGDDLAAAIGSAASGATLSLADGTYAVTGPIRIEQPITLLSASGQRDGVTIDGGKDGGNLFEISASDVTIAHLTLTASYDDLVAIRPDGADVTGIRLHDVHLLDAGRFAITVNGDDAGHYVDGGELSCSSIELSDDGRFDIREQCNAGGIDAYGARGWTVRDNRIEGLWCDIGSARPAIRFTRGSRDTEVTRNTLIDDVLGIVLGETQDQIGRVYDDAPCGPTVLQHIDGRITNNIVAAFDQGIVESNNGVVAGIRAESSCNVRVLHNSVYSAIEPGSSIEHSYPTTTGVFGNNLLSHAIRRLQESVADDVQNLENQPFDTWYYPAQRDFHTAPGASWAIDQGSTDFVEELAVDIDDEPRDDGLPDIGADEI